MGTAVAPVGGGRRVCHGLQPPPHLLTTLPAPGWGRTARLPRRSSHVRTSGPRFPHRLGGGRCVYPSGDHGAPENRIPAIVSAPDRWTASITCAPHLIGVYPVAGEASVQPSRRPPGHLVGINQRLPELQQMREPDFPPSGATAAQPQGSLSSPP